MNKFLLTLTMIILFSAPAFADDTTVNDKIVYLQNEWAHIKYQISDDDAKLAAIHKLEEEADKIAAAYPENAEVKIWNGIILSTDAGIVKGISALSKVKRAKELLETSLSINPNAMEGSAYASLGSLYYQVPGWPIGFGDDKKAEEYLKKALEVNSTNIDSNFFYADFLLKQKRFDEAEKYLNTAINAPNRENRQVADEGRRQEIKSKLAKIEKTRKTSTNSTTQYN